MTKAALLLLSVLPAVDSLAVLNSARWPALQQQLDRLPVFTVCNADGKPLQYAVAGQGELVIFYADVEAAKAGLATTIAELGEAVTSNCDIVPFGLGDAYRLQCEGKAVLVPGEGELQKAGMPPTGTAIGQPLPLFACMEMSRDGPDGPVLPLFMSCA